MLKVNDWSTIRSGATMTVTGREVDLKQPVKLTGVAEVKTDGDGIWAMRGGKAIAELIGPAKC